MKSFEKNVNRNMGWVVNVWIDTGRTPIQHTPNHIKIDITCHFLSWFEYKIYYYLPTLFSFTLTLFHILVKMILSHPAVFIHVVPHTFRSNYVIITNFLLRDYDAYIPYYCLINTFRVSYTNWDRNERVPFS